MVLSAPVCVKIHKLFIVKPGICAIFIVYYSKLGDYMLELRNITKIYPADSGDVAALQDVNLQFRKSEFVSILGPSGCGKTTLLNIVGGLDQYTDGDLVINGRSTKNFKDRDWDTYRNHSVGFVFQSYNLIPHQTVLSNVELALTLSGVSKAERKRRAKEALERVGLGDQLRKKPNQLSGGQMQRVAIARAIVNDPDIILADEPTGALDTQTSIQVMEILKEISQDRLVVMVTHNPELAETYSSRIVRLLDGQLQSDSQPFTQEELEAAQAEAAEMEKARKTAKKKEKKPSMSLFTSFGLSLKNLISKKGRTTLTAFAGSIGIIGIALIYAVSQGMTTYIDALQEDTLASYPVTIEAESMNMSSLLEIFMGQAESHGQHENDAVYQKTMLYDLINALNSMESTTNDLKSFKVFLEEQLADPDSKLSQSLSGIQYTYDLDMIVYTHSVDGVILQADTEKLLTDLMKEVLGTDITGMMELSGSYGMDLDTMTAMSPMGSTILFQEMLPGKDGSLISPMMEEQYDVIYGSWPNDYDEIVLVVDENNEIDDLTLYALGLTPKKDIDALSNAAVNQQTVEITAKSWSYEEICSREYRVVFNSDCFVLDEGSGLYMDLRDTETGLKYLYDNALPLKVSGIIRPNEDAVSTIMKGTIGYTDALTRHVIENNKNNPAVQAQLEDPDKDIFTGLPFKSTTGTLTPAEKETEFNAYVAELTDEERIATYIKILSIPSAEEVENMRLSATQGKTREDYEAAMFQALAENPQLQSLDMEQYIKDMSDEELQSYYEEMAVEMGKLQYAQNVQATMQKKHPKELLMGFEMALETYTQEQKASYYDQILEFSESTYEDNLLALGCLDLESPASINLYAVSFESKDVIEEVITDYNACVDELHKIQYTDFMGIMMDSITTIINAITYVLIAFVSVSLIVSSIMIGVITLISVQERTKEIGVLRAIGASKRNVSNMFNAETILIGFASGLLGVVVTMLLCIPINAILFALTGIPNLQAYLPLQVAALLVLISVVLTMLAGLIPARSAAKKDPVVALRTE